MQNTFKRLALLVIALLSCLCVTLGLSACGDKEPETATYSVTVTVTTTATDLTLTTIKAQWLNADDSAASDEIALNSDGKASVELNKGDYTVTLKGVPAGYTFEKKSVSADNPDATIAIAKSQDDSTTTTFSIKVTMPAGESLPADAKVQLFKGETPVGTAAALNANGQATLTADNGEYSVILTGLPAYLTYPTTTVKTDDKESAEIVVDYATLTYTINVEAEAGVSLDGVKVQLWSTAATPEKVAEGDIEEGVATIQAKAADYTVVLDGLASGAIYNEGAVSKTVTEVDISVSLNKITVTVAKGDNASSIAYDSLTIKFMSGSTEVATATPNAQGEAVITVAPGSYTVTLAGLPATGFMCDNVIVGANTTSVQLTIKATPDCDSSTISINSNGNYYLYSIGAMYSEMTALSIVFTAPENGLYTFSWARNQATCRSANTDALIVENIQGTADATHDIKVNLTENATITLIMVANTSTIVNEEKYYFDFTISSEETPAKGAFYNPYTFEYDGEGNIQLQKYTTDVKDAYFIFSANARGTYVITPDAGVSVYECTLAGTEEILVAEDLAIYTITDNVTHLHFTSTTANIGVTFANYEYTGEGRPEENSAITVTLGEPAEFDFGRIPANILPYAWFKFTTGSESIEYYYITNISNLDTLYVLSQIPETVNEYTSLSWQALKTVSGSDSMTGYLQLEQETTYYFAVTNTSLKVEFSISEFELGDEQTGDMMNPLSITDGTITLYNGESPLHFNDNYPKEATISKYYKYTSTSSKDVLLVISNIVAPEADYQIINSVSANVYYYGTSYGASESYGRNESFWRFKNDQDTYGNGCGAIIVKPGQTVFISFKCEIQAYTDENVQVGNISFDFKAVEIEDANADNTITGVTDNWDVKYYKYTPSADGKLVITFSNCGDNLISLALYKDENGKAYENSDKIFVGLNMEGGIIDPNTVYYISNDSVTSDSPVYFTIDYKGTNASFGFHVDVISATAANNGSNTVTVADKQSLQIRQFTYTPSAIGYIYITVSEDSSIKEIRLNNNILNSYVKIDSTTEQTLTVLVIGNDNLDFTITYYTLGTASSETVLGNATTTETKAYYTYTATEAGFYTFSCETEGVNVTAYNTSDQELKTVLLNQGASLDFYVVYTANEDTVNDVTLKITKVDYTTAEVGDNNTLGNATETEQIKYFEINITEKAFYTIAATGDVEATIQLYRNSGTQISNLTLDSKMLLNGNYIIVVTFTGNQTDAKLAITKVEPTEITDMEHDLADVGETNQIEILKFKATDEATYAFTVMGTNVQGTVTVYSTTYDTKSDLKLTANEEVILRVVYRATTDETAQNVKLKVEKMIIIDLENPNEDTWSYARIGNATTEQQTVTFTVNVWFEGWGGMEPGYFSGFKFYIKFSNDNGTTDITDQIEVTEITITTANGTEFDGNIENGYKLTNMYDSSSTCTIVMTYKLKSGSTIDNLYVGVANY